jgi:hypothetical protein
MVMSLMALAAWLAPMRHWKSAVLHNLAAP